ncbi:hypothetical protein [Marilutibacter alkalisoli]|uniref:Uncharacterized protein n=1 Tax=Marilutibacter alkalisoli TaxID=2591633 RepID=A0A514BTM2_9GAMM|nr:hypothetical protein [Lysobacter alkalisoli]QDH70754.1 hypothetical protein FKV23_12180 [Lysobacter alkalisoli]
MGRGIWIGLLIVAGIGWWHSPYSPRDHDNTAYAADVDCALPPRVTPGAPPLQSAVPSRMSGIDLPTARLTPLAGFSLDARVLSRRDYSRDREADLSPTDLALGWARMSDDAVLDRLAISQSGRWYHYRWQGNPPLPPREIASSSANMHLIPANSDVAKQLKTIKPGDRVRIDGWLIEAQAPDGWRWRSSTSRTDTGAGACEVVYACSIERV